MGQDRKTISLNLEVSDLARLDYACNLMSYDLGFKLSRTNVINRMVSKYLEDCNIEELERKQIRLSLD